MAHSHAIPLALSLVASVPQRQGRSVATGTTWAPKREKWCSSHPWSTWAVAASTPLCACDKTSPVEAALGAQTRRASHISHLGPWSPCALPLPPQEHGSKRETLTRDRKDHKDRPSSTHWGDRTPKPGSPLLIPLMAGRRTKHTWYPALAGCPSPASHLPWPV